MKSWELKGYTCYKITTNKVKKKIRNETLSCTSKEAEALLLLGILKLKQNNLLLP